MVLSMCEALSASHSGFCCVEDVTSPSAVSEAEWRTKFKIPGVIERPKVQSRQADVTNYYYFFHLTCEQGACFSLQRDAVAHIPMSS